MRIWLFCQSTSDHFKPSSSPPVSAVLAALQKHACPESLALARTLLDDPEVAAEARLAVESIENSLSYRR